VAEDPAHKAARILAKSAANLKDAHRSAVTDAALEAKKILLDEANKVASGGRLRNVGRSGAKLGVGFEVSTSGSGARAIVKARGPWQLVERGNRPHVIRPRRRRGKRALSFDGRAYASVRHPGTRGKEPWAKGQAKAGPKVAKILATRYIRAVGSAWS
jgi:hypothetical protein